MKAVVFWVLIFTSFSCFSTTDSLVKRFGLQTSYHPYDFFTGIHFSIQRKTISHKLALNTGVIRTVFQSRMYPQLSYQFGVVFVNKTNWDASLLLQPTFSLLNINKAAQHGHHYWEELFLGASIGVGKKIRTRLSVFIGPNWEQSWSVATTRFQTYFTWKYMGEISCSYVL